MCSPMKEEPHTEMPDHILNQELSLNTVWMPDPATEPIKSALEAELSGYILNHYHNGAHSISGKSEDQDVLTVCIEAHAFQPDQFWEGHWCSQWVVTLNRDSVELRGVLKVQVHYYEDGNMKLVSHKNITETLMMNDAPELAKEIVRLVASAENEYQIAIVVNCQTMSDTGVKVLRRQLPITRTKIEWNKIPSYRIVKELNIQQC